MNIKLISIGKTDNKALESLIEIYTKRLSRYVNFKFLVLPDIKHRKNLSFEQQKEQEGNLLLKNVATSDWVVLLDEKGKTYSSKAFSEYLAQKMLAGTKQLVFIIGGPYGFSQKLYKRANQQVSLSKMTFSHQMIRLFFVEQLYRGFTILKNEPYHHQ